MQKGKIPGIPGKDDGKKRISGCRNRVRAMVRDRVKIRVRDKVRVRNTVTRCLNEWCRSILPNRISPNRSPSWVYCRAPTEIELGLG